MENAHDWLLQQLSTANTEELIKICITLWGIWYWRNKKVWEGKTVTFAFAMSSSFQVQAEWIQARQKQERADENHMGTRTITHQEVSRWKPPALGTRTITH